MKVKKQRQQLRDIKADRLSVPGQMLDEDGHETVNFEDEQFDLNDFHVDQTQRKPVFFRDEGDTLLLSEFALLLQIVCPQNQGE